MRRLLLLSLALVARSASAQQAEAKAFESSLKALAPPAPPAAAPAAPGYAFSDGSAEGALGEGSMRKANRAAAEILKRRMQEERPDELRLVREAAGAEVVVVSGSYDRVQDVLRAVDIKHVVIPPHLLEKLDLLPTQTLMVNC